MSLAFGMKMVINLFCDGFADSLDAFQVGEPGAGDTARRAEMVQQRLLALGANAGDLVERRAGDRHGPLLAVGADREAMGLVAQALQVIEHRVFRLQAQGFLALAEETLAPGVTIRSL